MFYEKPFDFFFERIKNNKHFRYSRFNDGELNAMENSNPNAANCDGHQYFPQMGRELSDILLKYAYSDDYIIESFDYWYGVLPNVKRILNALKNVNPFLQLLNKDFIRISHEQEPENFMALLKLLNEKNVVVVGPYYLKNLNKYFNFRYINVPLRNCYLEKERIVSEMKSISDNENDVFFLLSASMGANVIIDQFNDGRNTYLNWGSTWDTFFVSPEFSFIRKRSSSMHEKYKSIYKNYLI